MSAVEFIFSSVIFITLKMQLYLITASLLKVIMKVRPCCAEYYLLSGAKATRYLK